MSDASTEPTTFPGAAEDLEVIEDKLWAMPRSEVQVFRFSVPRAVANALRVHRAYVANRPRFEETFKPGAFDAEVAAGIARSSGALWQADVLLRQVVTPTGLLDEILAKATPLRSRMLNAAMYLWLDDAELGPQVAEIRSGSGHMDQADDLVALATLFDQRFAEVKDSSKVTRGDVGLAAELGMALMKSLDPPGSAEIDRARDLRNRAGTYLRRQVDLVRAAAGYVHRDDPEALRAYPSLQYRPRRPRRAIEPGPAADGPEGVDHD